MEERNNNIMKHGMKKRFGHLRWYWNNKDYIKDKNYCDPEHPIKIGTVIEMIDRNYIVDNHGSYVLKRG